MDSQNHTNGQDNLAHYSNLLRKLLKLKLLPILMSTLKMVWGNQKNVENGWWTKKKISTLLDHNMELLICESALIQQGVKQGLSCGANILELGTKFQRNLAINDTFFKC